MTRRGKKSKGKGRRSTRKAKAQQSNRYLIIGAVVIIVLVGLGFLLLGPRIGSSSQTANENQSMADAKILYDNNCASCHGEGGQGHIQLNAPALDSSEHAWHHADEQLISIIRNGGANMPPVGSDFSDEDVVAVIAYFKQWWTQEHKDFQPGEIGE